MAIERFSNTDVVNTCDAPVLSTTQPLDQPSYIFHETPEDIESSEIKSISSNDDIDELYEPKVNFQSADTNEGKVIECSKCRRKNNSPSIPLQFVKIACHKIIHRLFHGENLKNHSGELITCLECANFVTHSKGACWKYSWPSTLYAMMCDSSSLSRENVQLLKNWMPQSYRLWWQHVLSFSNASQGAVEEPVFRDITADIQKFVEKFENKKLSDYDILLNENPYCDVKCVNGDTTFVSETGGIGFHHFLQFHFPDFCHFGANYEQHLAAMRSDYLDSYIRLDEYKIMPCLKIDPHKGLVLATCHEHNNGSNKRMIHLPCNPVLGHLSPVNNSLFASFSACPRTLKTGQLGFNSHTYQLYKASGGFSGISTVQIRTNENISQQSELNCKADSLAAQCRRDFKCEVDRKLEQNRITEKLHEDLTYDRATNFSSPIQNEIEDSLKAATCVDFGTAMKLKLSMDSNSSPKTSCEHFNESEKTFQTSIDRPSILLLVQPSQNPFGARPFRLKKDILTNDILWRFVTMMQFIPQLWDELVAAAQFSADLQTLRFYLMKTLPRIFTGSTYQLPKNIRQLGSEGTAAVINDLTRQADGPLPNIASLLSRLDNVQVCNLENRRDVHADFISNQPKIVVFICSKRTDPSSVPPPKILTDKVNTFELQYMSTCNSHERNAIACYGGHYEKFWNLNSNKLHASQCAARPSMCVEKYSTSWELLLYVLRDSPDIRSQKYQYLQHMGGQGRFICGKHDVPLTKNPRGTNITCSFIDSCKKTCSRKAIFRCPSDGCSASVCLTHFNEDLLQNTQRQFVTPIEETDCAKICSLESEDDNEDTVSDEFEMWNTDRIAVEDFHSSDSYNTDTDTDSETDNPFNFATDSGIANTLEEYANDGADATDSGAFHTTANLKAVPSHVILVGDTHVLKRYKHPISVSANNARFLQNMVANSPGNSNPLLYVEAGLFPDIIWYQNEDGSYPGAIPASLYGSDKNNAEVGMASIRDHFVTRIKNASLPCASNPAYIQFAFDVVFNSILKQHDTRVVLKRGWQDIKHGSSSYNPETSLKFDVADSRKNVMELGAAIASEPPTYFLTLTCNQSQHPGVAPIFQALQRFLDKYKGNEAMTKAIVQSEMVNMIRAWERAANILMDFIEKSPDQPLGPVKKIWYRFEFQSSKGNFPHIHCIIWTGEDKFSNTVRNRIVCKRSRMKFEIDDLINKGLIPDVEKAREIYKDACVIQAHNCDHSGGHCQKLRDGKLVCKVPLYPACHQYTYKLHNTTHSEAVWNILSFCDLATTATERDDWKIGPEMQGGKHQYPADKGEHLSPFSPLIFALTRSSQNLQISDTVLAARYMTKYSAGVEEHSKVKFYAGSSINTLNVEEAGIQNEKITGVQAELKQKNAKERKRNFQEGRVIGITETVWWLLNFGYVRSSFDFIHLPTVPIECRGAIKLKNKRPIQHANNFCLQSLAVREKLLFPAYRLPSTSQIEILRDNLIVETTMDKMTLFGLRPPELLFVSSPVLYFRWFVREKPTGIPNKVNKDDYLLHCDSPIECYWVDLTAFVVKLRPSAVEPFLQFIYERQNNKYTQFNFVSCSNQFLQFFHQSTTNTKFVSNNPCLSKTVAEVVTSNILPSNPSRFLIHLILSMGHFETELDLFKCATLLDVFRKAELLSKQENMDMANLKAIMRKYILQQLMFLPGGVHIFDRHCEQSWQILQSFVTEDIILYQEPPPTLLQQIVSENEQKVTNELLKRKLSLIKAVCANTQFSHVPSIDELWKASLSRPVTWKPSITQSPNQTALSFEMQADILDRLIDAIDCYSNNQTFHPHQVVIGPPGTGKTFLLLQAVLYAISKGFYCTLTSLPAERASLFGGLHIHANAGLSTNENHSVAELAAFGINKLSKDPIALAFIRKINVLFVEEIGMISAEQYCAVDLIYQHIRGNRVPLGGVLLIGTGDARQLRPPSGTLLWMSPLMLTSFTLHPLTEFVRMDQKGDGQKLLKLMGTSEIDESTADQIVNIIADSCNFVSDWDSIVETPGVIRVFGTRAAERDAIQRVLTKIENDDTVEKFVAPARDQYSVTGTTNWKDASATVTKMLNSKALEPQTLTFYKFAPLRLTTNNLNEGYTQGQLCLVRKIPSSRDPSVEVYLSPYGNREYPPNPSTFDFIANGWKIVKLLPHEGHVFSARGMSLRRIQYPVKHFFAATIHKTMGETLPGVVTKVSTTENQ